jgi:hypothetical protein
MNFPALHFALPVASIAPHVNSVILYDRLVSGVCGKVFCEVAAEEIASGCRSTNLLHRMDLLDLPAIASQAALEAATSDFIVVALTGDEDLSSAARRWLQAQISRGCPRRRFVALVEGASAHPSDVAERVREWLGEICRSASVEFVTYQGKMSDGGHAISFVAQDDSVASAV